MSQPALQAALKRSAAENYPYLPVGVWSAARQLADVVATHRGIPAAGLDRIGRVLSAQDFMFRRGAAESQ